MNSGRRGYDVAIFQIALRAVFIGDDAACLADHQCPGGAIPRLQFPLPEAIETAGRDVGQVQGSRPGVADSRALRAQTRQAGQMIVQVTYTPEWEAGGQKRTAQFPTLIHGEGFKDPRAAAAPVARSANPLVIPFSPQVFSPEDSGLLGRIPTKCRRATQQSGV